MLSLLTKESHGLSTQAVATVLLSPRGHPTSERVTDERRNGTKHVFHPFPKEWRTPGS